MASSEDTLRMSENGDIGSEEAVTKEKEQGDKVEMDSEKEVEVEKEREKEVEVEKGIDPWSYKHGSLPCWWWLTAITIGPILLILRLISLAVLLISRFVKKIVSLWCMIFSGCCNKKEKTFMCFSFILVKLALLGNVDLDQPLVGWRRNAQAMIKSYYGDHYSNAR